MHARSFLLMFAAAVLPLAGCGRETSETLTVYSGRSRALVEPLVEKFRKTTGIDANVKYGRGPQLIAAMEEEGSQSPADVFWANTVGALGQARKKGLLRPLPKSLKGRDVAFAGASDHWIPVTTRFRVLAYNSDKVDPADLPKSVMKLPDRSALEGRIGWTPTYTSFQDFVTAMRKIHGRKAAAQWLKGMKALSPKAYPSNTPMVRALARGEIDVALTNHYYVLRLKHGGAEGEYEGEEHKKGEHAKEGHEKKEQKPKPDAPVEIYHFEPGDVGNLALVTGGAVLKTATAEKKAARFLRFLLSKEAQAFAAKKVHEYPVVEGTPAPDRMMEVGRALDLSPKDFDFDQLRDLEATMKLLRQAGLV